MDGAWADGAASAAALLGAIASALGAGSGFIEAAPGGGGFELDRAAPSSSIAAMRAAFVGDAGSALEVVEAEGGIDEPPFLSRADGFDDFDRGLETGVPSGARRTM